MAGFFVLKAANMEGIPSFAPMINSSSLRLTPADVHIDLLMSLYLTTCGSFARTDLTSNSVAIQTAKKGRSFDLRTSLELGY